MDEKHHANDIIMEFCVRTQIERLTNARIEIIITQETVVMQKLAMQTNV